MGIGIGGGTTKSSGSTDTTENTTTSGSGWSESSMAENPWGAQGEQLDQLWHRANALYQTATHGSEAEAGVDDLRYDAATERFNAAGEKERGLVEGWKNLQKRDEAQYGKFDTMTDQLMGLDSDSAMSGATEWAQNNPYLENAIDQSWGRAEDMLGQRVGGVGGINHNAATTGNMSSSRAGVAEGVARAEAAKSGQEAELAMRQGAFDQGLSQYNQQRSDDTHLADMLETDPRAAGSLLAGAQGSYEFSAAERQQALDDMMRAAQGAESRQWGRLGSMSDMIQQGDWGGTSTERVDEANKSQSSMTGTEKSKGSSSKMSLSGNLGA